LCVGSNTSCVACVGNRAGDNGLLMWINWGLILFNKL
jgi:hypothetical protein